MPNDNLVRDYFYLLALIEHVTTAVVELNEGFP